MEWLPGGSLKERLIELGPLPIDEIIDIGDYYGDFSLIKQVAGWEPKISLEEGLKRTVEYFKPRKRLYW